MKTDNNKSDYIKKTGKKNIANKNKFNDKNIKRKNDSLVNKIMMKLDIQNKEKSSISK